MHVLVTGAAGFVGQALVDRLLGDSPGTLRPVSRLTAVDQRFGNDAQAWAADRRVLLHEGDFGAPALLDAALAEPADLVFHLASVPGALAEREPALGTRVNLHGALVLFERLAAARTGLPGRVVFASSIAVYGELPFEQAMDESAVPRPALSYGAHKLMAEVQLADLSRRGGLDGLSLRMPGIVARPPSASGHGSAFMSDVIRRLHAGEACECPVSAQARCWWMSRRCCVDNLLHAAGVAPDRLPLSRVVQLPVIAATVGEVAQAAARVGGHAPRLRHRADPSLEALFGRMPQLHAPRARELGFRDDGSLEQLVVNALA